MNTRGIQTMTGAAFLIAASACSPAKPAAPVGPLDLTITFAAPTAGVCAATMAAGQQNARAHRTQKITWTLDGTKCSGFDAKLACLDFMDDVMKGSRHLCGNGASKINGEVTGDAKKAPDGSTHHYDIKYDGNAAGDPELDINCDTCDTGTAK